MVIFMGFSPSQLARILRFSLAAGLPVYVRGSDSVQQVQPQVVWLASIQPFTGGAWDAGISMRVGAEIMLEEVNRHTNLLPGLELKVVWQDGSCSASQGEVVFLRNAFMKEYVAFAPDVPLDQLDSDGDGTITSADTLPLSEVWNSTLVSPAPIGLLGPGCSATSMAISQFANLANWPVVSNSATMPALSDRSLYPNFFRTIMPDTAFNAAWVAMARILGHYSIVCVFAELEVWQSLAEALSTAATEQGVSLEGDEFPDQLPEKFRGYAIARHSQSMAADIIKRSKQRATRFVVLQMYASRARLLLCEAYKAGYANVVWMSMGWFSAGWWAVPDTECDGSAVTEMATGLIAANFQFWRSDMQASLSCSESMTAESFRAAWLSRQNATLDDMSMRPEGYAPALEAATTADAVCMYAWMLHEVLVLRGLPLEALASKTPDAYAMVQEAFASTDFEGVQGRVRFAHNSADPDGSVIVQQVQSGRLVDIATYADKELRLLGLHNLTFGLPGENFFAGPSGATELSAELARFRACPGETILDFQKNECEACQGNTEFVDIVGECRCKAGFVADGNTCVGCAPGHFSANAGAGECSECPPGRSTNSSGSTACERCAAGKFANHSASTGCFSCPSVFTTHGEGSESVGDCVCGPGTSLSNSGTCDGCWATFEPRFQGLDHECVCPAEHRYDHLSSPRQCVRCEAHLLYCPGGHVQGNESVDSTVGVRDGYMTVPSDPFSVYTCAGQGACHGTRMILSPSMCTDLLDHEQPRCAVCEEGATVNIDGTCSPCADYFWWSALLKGIATFLVQWVIIVQVYFRVSRPKTCIEGILESMIMFVQTMQVLGKLDLVLPDALSYFFTLLDYFSVGQFDVNLGLRFDCFVRRNFESTIVQQALAPILLFVDIALLQLVCFLKNRRWLNSDYVHNLVGLIFTGLFVMLVGLSLSLFYTIEMPNGKVMVVAFPELEYTSKDWWRVLPVNLATTLLYGVTTICYIVHTVWTAPRRVATEANFMSRYRFCFGTVRPDRWWWILAQLAFAVSVNLLQVLLPAAVVQAKVCSSLVCTFMFTLLVYAVWPSKYDSSNWTETMFKGTVIVYLGLATSFVDVSKAGGELHDRVNTIWGYVILGAITAALAVALFLLARAVFAHTDRVGVSRVRASRIGWQLRDLTAAMLLMPESEFARRLHLIGDRDCALLQEASRRIIHLIFGKQASDRWTGQRLIAGSPYEVWDHSRSVVDVLRHIRTGSLAEAQERSYRLRCSLLQLAHAIYEEDSTVTHRRAVRERKTTNPLRHRSTIHERFDKIKVAIGAQTGPALSSMVDASWIRRVQTSVWLHRETKLTRESFAEVIEHFGLSMQEEGLNAIFDVLDCHGSGEATMRDLTNLLSGLAPEELVAAAEGEVMFDASPREKLGDRATNLMVASMAVSTPLGTALEERAPFAQPGLDSAAATSDTQPGYASW